MHRLYIPSAVSSLDNPRMKRLVHTDVHSEARAEYLIREHLYKIFTKAGFSMKLLRKHSEDGKTVIFTDRFGHVVAEIEILVLSHV